MILFQVRCKEVLAPVISNLVWEYTSDHFVFEWCARDASDAAHREKKGQGLRFVVRWQYASISVLARSAMSMGLRTLTVHYSRVEILKHVVAYLMHRRGIPGPADGAVAKTFLRV